MKAIYASKMYKSSKRKEKIRAALSNPVNAELVQQLREYLDDEYLTTEYFGTRTDNTEEDVNRDSEANMNDDDLSNTSHSSTSIPAPPHRSSELFDSLNDESSDTDDISNEAESDEDSVDNEQDSEESEVQESVDINKESVTAQTTLYTRPEDNINKLPEIVEEVKGTLNSRKDTCDVNRVLSKENELWIYYDDKINLNNVMGPAIELLNASNYTFLDFNRLARSENAMVFQINLSDSNTDVKSLKEDKDEGNKE